MVSQEEFIEACAEGNIDIVRQYIAEGGDIKTIDNNGNTGLMYASNYGHIDLIVELLAAGADVNAQNEAGTTALMMAVWSGYTDCVRELVKAGADINIVDCDHSTAMTMAITKDCADCLYELFDCGANINAVNLHGYNLAAGAICGDRISIDCLRLLTSIGWNINSQNKFGRTVLNWAFDYKEYDAAPLLVELGADIYAKDNDGKAAIDYCDDEEVREQLIQIYHQRANTKIAIASADKPYLIQEFDIEL